MEDHQFLQNLIRYVVDRGQDRDSVILRTRLVKLLYLCDIESYRATRQRLTGLRWVRYLYGPFAFELQQATHGIGFDLEEETVDFETGHGVRYSVRDLPDPEKWLPTSAMAIVDRVIDRWADADLNALLDYVYCDTEPMQGAEFLQPLDFRRVVSGLRYGASPVLDLPPEQVRAIREKAENSQLLSRIEPPSSTDQELAKAMVSIESSPNLAQLAGKVSSGTDDPPETIGGRE